jgi:hypothetical protein
MGSSLLAAGFSAVRCPLLTLVLVATACGIKSLPRPPGDAALGKDAPASEAWPDSGCSPTFDCPAGRP